MQKASLHTFLRLVGFLALAGLAFAGSGLVSGTLFAMLAIPPDRPLAAWMFPATATGMLLLATWCALRVEGLGFAALGMAPTRRRLLEFAKGLAMGAALFGLLAMLTGWLAGARWHVDWVAGARSAFMGLPLALLMLMPEELVFRGYAFRKAQVLWGAPVALALSSLAFGAYHLVGSNDWAMGALFRFAMPVLGGLLFGYALLRTGGMAMPIGLHLGGNWIQSSVFGLGRDKGSALLTAPLDAEQIRMLTAPDLVTHMPYLLAIALLGIFVAMLPSRGKAELADGETGSAL